MADLHQSGNESVNSLLGMLRMYKRKKDAAHDEIERLNKLCILKESEIEDLNQSISQLTHHRATFGAKAQDDIDRAHDLMKENQTKIKRQDKLIVDLMQQNEITDL